MTTTVRKIDVTIEKNTATQILCVPSLNLTGYTFFYVVKKFANDLDVDAALTLTPVLDTMYVSELSQGMKQNLDDKTVVVLQVNFLPADTRTIAKGTYYHYCRAVSSDGLVVLNVFDGKIVFNNGGIAQP